MVNNSGKGMYMCAHIISVVCFTKKFELTLIMRQQLDNSTRTGIFQETYPHPSCIHVKFFGYDSNICHEENILPLKRYIMKCLEVK